MSIKKPLVLGASGFPEELQATDTLVKPFQILGYSNNSNTYAASTTVYQSPFPGVGGAAASGELNKAVIMPAAGDFSSFYLRTNSIQSATGSLIWTFRRAPFGSTTFANTLLKVTIPISGAINVYTDLINSAHFDAGDLLSISIQNNATAVSNAVQSWACIFTAD